MNMKRTSYHCFRLEVVSLVFQIAVLASNSRLTSSAWTHNHHHHHHNHRCLQRPKSKSTSPVFFPSVRRTRNIYPSYSRTKGTHQALCMDIGDWSEDEDGDAASLLFLEVIGAAGVSETELGAVLEGFEYVFQDIGIPLQYDTSNVPKYILSAENTPLTSIEGALERVILLELGIGNGDGPVTEDDEWIEELRVSAAATVDELLNGGREEEDGPIIAQPIVVSIQPRNNPSFQDTSLAKRLSNVLQQQVEIYELAKPLLRTTPATKDSTSETAMIPSTHIEIDGAFVDDPYSTDQQVWDTSSILIFDDLVNEDIRQRLLDVVLGRHSNSDDDPWDDIQNGPDPKRWERGGLIDIPDDDESADTAATTSTSWGLKAAAIEDICFQHHDAIAEFEEILTDLFPQYIVTRLPEAVFGDTVSPLTANAPTLHDLFDYHIDGDPNLMPPSPWTDIYGRYPNRARGKPRFMSCLLYLNDEWEPEWGAPTRFLDPPTQTEHDIIPRPRRCLLMDQDCSHTVVAPNSAAGNRPRYSLVWKLILHPKSSKQDMTKLSGVQQEAWPEPILFGSAKR
mmetsp:Transcript_58360/g.142717  ORF Transcript_58360/g.142717 Transcript_58360/m.142717 type:complete len:566 (-) Transcript_58360:90-1787(-)